MIIRVMFKTPDAVDGAVQEAVERLLDTPEAKDLSLADVASEAKRRLEKFVEYGESVTIEFDTEKMEARVIPVAEP